MASKPCPSLTERHQFLHLKKEGDRAFATNWLLMNFAVNDRAQLRVGVTVSRKIGSAVVRNRFKRWCREFFRSLDQEQKGRGIDVNVIFRPKTKDFYKGLSHPEVHKALARAWQKLESKAVS